MQHQWQLRTNGHPPGEAGWEGAVQVVPPSLPAAQVGTPLMQRMQKELPGPWAQEPVGLHKGLEGKHHDAMI